MQVLALRLLPALSFLSEVADKTVPTGPCWRCCVRKTPFLPSTVNVLHCLIVERIVIVAILIIFIVPFLLVVFGFCSCSDSNL